MPVHLSDDSDDSDLDYSGLLQDARNGRHVQKVPSAGVVRGAGRARGGESFLQESKSRVAITSLARRAENSKRDTLGMKPKRICAPLIFWRSLGEKGEPVGTCPKPLLFYTLAVSSSKLCRSVLQTRGLLPNNLGETVLWCSRYSATFSIDVFIYYNINRFLTISLMPFMDIHNCFVVSP